jgi:adenosylhomocysteinase
MPITTPSQALPWEWASDHMPLLRRTAEECGPSLSGLTIGVCLHLEPKTAVLVHTLVRLGMRVHATGSPGTTQQEIVEVLTAVGAEIYAHRDDAPEQHAQHVRTIVSRRPDLLLDNGGDLIVEAVRRGVRVTGATEETTTGGVRLRSRAVDVPFPVIVINDSRLKLLIENEYGVGQSVVQGFMNATNLMLPGMRAVVVGFGPCGKGVANTLSQLGARVTVVEPDPFRALEAVMAGHAIAEIEHALGQAKAVFLASGIPDAVPISTLHQLADGGVLVGVSHFPQDVDLGRLRQEATGSRQLKTRHASLEQLNFHGRTITMINGLHMVNLSAGPGNPIEAMDLGLSLQLRSLAWVASGQADWEGPKQPPREVEVQVAEGMVERLSGRTAR